MIHDFEVAPLSWAQIDNQAHKLRADFDLQNVPFFDGIKLLEQVLDNTLGFVRLEVEEDHQMPTAEGLTDPRGEFIRLRESVYRGAWNRNPRDRWTVHHELGHLFIHSRRTMKRVHPETPVLVQPFRSAEAQANRFAAALTMPAYLIRPEMSVDDLMVTFGASRMAATNRIKSLFGKMGR
jgi:IrrE N-terminal-like domain